MYIRTMVVDIFLQIEHGCVGRTVQTDNQRNITCILMDVRDMATAGVLQDDDGI